jgi:hypothetical protein
MKHERVSANATAPLVLPRGGVPVPVPISTSGHLARHARARHSAAGSRYATKAAGLWGLITDCMYITESPT